MALSLSEFVGRWRINSLSERAGAQSHFIDLCDMLGEPHPAAADSVGERYAFEKPIGKVYGGYGFADVWMRDHFAWEYKANGAKKHKDLKAAYKQLNDYREELGNPPLLVVCDMDRFEVHTNFTNTDKRVYTFDLKELGQNSITPSCPLPPLDVLRALFRDYSVLRPNRTDALVTREVAKRFSKLAERLEIEKRAHTDTPIHTKEEIAHFLMRILFCLFADSVGLLPGHIFKRLIADGYNVSLTGFQKRLRNLFEAMSEKGSIFGEHDIKYFNGGLFDSSSTIVLDKADLGILYEASKNYNWAHVAPEIFGTLFERSLNPQRRSLIGAHYTSAEDILLLIDPVIMAPLEARWANVRTSALLEIEKEMAAAPAPGDGKPQRALRLKQRESERLLADWFAALTAVRVLDPACGSGNFLYLALKRLLDLYQLAASFVSEHNLSPALPKMPSPEQLYGIEIEFLAHELASVVVWIGFLQWRHQHGDPIVEEPILKRLPNIEHDDAIMRYDPEGKPYEPEWPMADFIVGNPPFLGGKLLRRELGDPYVDQLFGLYKNRVKAESDLVVYWFEKARAQLETKQVGRVGLLATQAIRGGANRKVLERIQETGTIFWAWSDREWTLQGANVHVSMIAFEGQAPSDTPRKQAPTARLIPAQGEALGNEHPGTQRAESPTYMLDGKFVTFINSDLSSNTPTVTSFELKENVGVSFQGPTKIGAFEIEEAIALQFLSSPINPNGKGNSDVVKPWINGRDITGRPRSMYIVDFGTSLTEQQAALYEAPFEHIRKAVWPVRRENRRLLRAQRWWLHGETYPTMRKALAQVDRYIATPRVSKHRTFSWVPGATFPDSAIVVFARDDDYFFGVLHSKIHELWALSQGTQLEDRPRYTPNSTFSTFPFPWPPGTEPSEADSPIVRAIADAARDLVRLRDAWLNPPDTPESELKSRTLTNLYNKRATGEMTWLSNAHRTLDAAVFRAYNWPEPPETLPTQEILARLLTLNHQRALAQRI